MFLSYRSSHLFSISRGKVRGGSLTCAILLVRAVPTKAKQAGTDESPHVLEKLETVPHPVGKASRCRTMATAFTALHINHPATNWRRYFPPSRAVCLPVGELF